MNSDQPDASENSVRVERARRMRRVQFGMALFVLCIGLVTFSNVAGNPRFEAYHTLDVIRFVTAGAAFGAALVLIVQFFKFRGTRP